MEIPTQTGWRRGLRQWWPVYERPIKYPPLVIGGQCPPYAPVTKVPGGYTCVETPEFVAEDLHQEIERRWLADEYLRQHPPIPIEQLGQEAAVATVTTQGDLATTMVLRGAVGSLIGAAVSPKGSEGVWAAIGFTMGATLGEMGIVGVALAALWKKAG